MTKSSVLVLSTKQQTITNSYYPKPLAKQPQFSIPSCDTPQLSAMLLKHKVFTHSLASTSEAKEMSGRITTSKVIHTVSWLSTGLFEFSTKDSENNAIQIILKRSY